MGDVRVSDEMRVWRLANPALGRSVNEAAVADLMAEFHAEERS